MEQRIACGQRILRRMRLKMAVVMITLGLLCLGMYLAIVLIWDEPPRCRTDWEDYVHFFILSSLLHARLLLWGLAPLYDDMRMMRLTMFVEMLVVLMEGISDFFLNYSLHRVAQATSWCVLNCLVVVGFLVAMRFTEAKPMRTYMWRTLQVWMWLGVLLNVFWQTLACIQCGHPTAFVTWVPPKVLLAALIMQPCQRQRYHSALLAWFEGRSQAQAAAAVAGLVGNCSAAEVVQLAGSRFRDIELASLRQEDLADNSPDPSLFARSSPASLNECDAFISHSWHDDADAKWAAMQHWRHRFVNEHGREPRVWIDKCCIDQSNIETDLRCLPAFVGGCRKFVVFCGPTYMCRLWCIVEVFTFVHMGRKQENLEVEIVLRDGHRKEDMSAIEKAVDEFDSERCDCFDQRDKERMLSIIFAASGCIRTFNGVVSSIFRTTRMKSSLVRSSSRVLGPSISEGESQAWGPRLLGAKSLTEGIAK